MGNWGYFTLLIVRVIPFLGHTWMLRDVVLGFLGSGKIVTKRYTCMSYKVGPYQLWVKLEPLYMAL